MGALLKTWGRLMAYEFNPPPGWPKPEPGWQPPPGWRPPAGWPPAPPDWQYWVEVPETKVGHVSAPIPGPPTATVPQKPAPERRGPGWGVIVGTLTGVVGVVLGLFAWLNPDPGNQPSSDQQRAAYLAEVDSMCAGAFLELAGQNAGTTDPEEYARSAEVAADTFGGVLERWAALDLPKESDDRLVRPILDSLEQMVASMRGVANWVRRDDPKEAGDEFQRLREHTTAYRKAARDYGLRTCLNIEFQ
jgi:hypothetical protein